MSERASRERRNEDVERAYDIQLQAGLAVSVSK